MSSADTARSISSADRTRLRDLAKQVADAAALPVQEERKALWTEHNSLRPCRPLMLIFPEGSWQELLPAEALLCETESARRYEGALRRRLYAHEHFADDMVLEKEWGVPPVVRSSGWGVQPRTIASSEARGAWHFDPVVKTPQDLARMHHPEIEVDEAAGERNLAHDQELFGDILDVRPVGVRRLCYHLMNQWTRLHGLEETMVDMFAEPAFLHEAMRFLTEGHKKLLRQHVDLGLLDRNDNNTYQGSGGVGWTDDLPQADFDGETVRPADMWGTAEAQEMAQVGPDQHREFVLEYEKELLAPYGLNAYGCCEDLTRKLDDVFTLPQIRRISISPWADVDACAERLRGDYVFSWKPHPSHLAGRFDDAAVRAYIRHTVEVCTGHGCRLEMVLKDTHTCDHQPERFDRWSRIAREEIERAG
jgi:hypothetical protein